MLQTFLANLQHAVRNKESVVIGGGEFTHGELRLVLKDIEQAVGFEKAATKENA